MAALRAERANRPVLLLDVDGPLFDINRKILDRFNPLYGTEYEPEHLTAWGYADCDPRMACAYEWFKEPEFFGEGPVVPGSQWAVSRLSRCFDVWAVTATPESGQPGRELWLAEHFPWISKVVFSWDKHLIYPEAFAFVDDAPRHFFEYTAKYMYVWGAPYNDCLADLPEAYMRVSAFTPELQWQVLMDELLDNWDRNGR
jgi:5'(3')-deoxyribonucleotidase